MAEFPALPLWTDAYLGDTTHLDCLEHGAYLLLLIVAWRTPDTRLPDDDKLLARYARVTARQWSNLRPMLAPFFDISGGFWTQNRLTDEKKIVERRRDSAAENGRLSALKRKDRHATKRPTKRERSDQRTVNEPATPTPTPNPTLERDNDKSSSLTRRAKKSDWVLPDDIPAEAWGRYVDMRERKKAAPTDGAKDLVVKRLRQFRDDGHDPAQILDQSTINNWTGVFEPKGNRNGRSFNQRDDDQSGLGVTARAAIRAFADDEPPLG